MHKKTIVKSKSPVSEQRFIRMKDIPEYLGISKNEFNRSVRPYLTTIPIGVQGIAFCTIEIKKLAAINGPVLLRNSSDHWHSILCKCGRSVYRRDIEFTITGKPMLRMKDAPSYLSMSKEHFNKLIRGKLHEFRIGKQGVGFYTLAINQEADEYMKRVGRPGLKLLEEIQCQKEPQVLQSKAKSGTSTKSSKENDFAKAQERVALMKRKGT